MGDRGTIERKSELVYIFLPNGRFIKKAPNQVKFIFIS